MDLSVIVTSYRRPEYLKNCIDSIRKYADIPFELIVHDDGSDVKTLESIYELKDRIDILIENKNNEGLNKAINRSVNLASSEYILFLCDDCWVRYPCFRDIVNVLSKEYIGWICPGDNRFLNNVRDVYCLSPPAEIKGARAGDTLFYLTNNLLGGYTQAFRKSIWKEIGGWEERASTGRSDNIFLFKLLKAGYWKGILPGETRIDLANNKEGYIPSAPLMKEQLYDRKWEEEQLYEPAGLANIQYWFDYYFEIFGTKFNSIFEMQNITYDAKRIDWNVASRHGQSKWRGQIENDFR